VGEDDVALEVCMAVLAGSLSAEVAVTLTSLSLTADTSAGISKGPKLP